MNKKGKIIGLSLAVIMVVSLFAVAIPSVAAQNGDKPDLVITGIQVVGNRIQYTIENIGAAAAPRSLTGLWINGVYRASDMVGPLAPGGVSGEVFTRYNYRGGEIDVCADYQDRIEEENNGNNCRGGLPDLVIIEKYETVDADTCEFMVHFTVCNVGESDAGASVACVYIDDEQVDEVDVDPLDADDCTAEITVGPFDCPPCEFVTIGVEADNYDEVDECDEENNLLENEFHCPAPDLVITDKYETVIPETCRFEVHFTVNNIGICDADPSVACVYIDGEQVGEVDVGPLPAGQCTEEITVGPFGCPPCEFVTIGVEADNYEAVDECDEENNLLENEFHCPAPDLVITDKYETVIPETCEFEVHFTVNNIGICDAGESVACYYIDGEQVGEVDVGPLPAGQCTEEITVGPFDCPPCEFVTIGVEADNYEAVDECDEENNLLENEFHCPAPDLVITYKYETVIPETCEFEVHFTVNNIGICDAGESVACYYIDGEQVGEVDVGPLPAGQCTEEITVGPFDCPPCEFVTIGVEADNYEAVDECNEENNLLENEFHCPAPDLIILDKYELVNPEDCTFTVTFVVANFGFCDAGASTACVYVDGDQVNVPIAAIAAFGWTAEITVGPFECTPCEFVTVIVEADNDKDVAECDEENNILENEFHCPGPDLVITDKEEIVDPETGRFTVRFTVNNIGICDAGESVACVYVDGVQVDEVFVDPLPADECTAEITVGPFECPLGEDIEVKVCADNNDAVEECDEGNNCMTNILPCPGVPLPDLVITDIRVVGNRIHYTIENQGGANAPRSLTGLWIDDIYRASEMDDPLAPGAELVDEVFARYTYRGGDIRVCADYQDRIEEIDNDNNCNWADD